MIDLMQQGAINVSQNAFMNFIYLFKLSLHKNLLK